MFNSHYRKIRREIRRSRRAAQRSMLVVSAPVKSKITTVA